MLRTLNFLLTRSSDRTSLRLRAMLRIPAVFVFAELLSVARFAVVLCSAGYSDASIVANCSCEQSTESVLSWYLSELSRLTRSVSPSLHHACILKCRSDMKCLNSPLSLLPSQFLGIRSLIRYGFRAGFAVVLCHAVAMPLNMSNLPLAVSFS